MNPIQQELQKVKSASRMLAAVSEEKINEVLLSLAEEIEKSTEYILTANKKDLDNFDPANPMYDRLQLTKDRLRAIAQDVRNVAALEYPLGRVLEERVLDNGLNISKVSVPLGVIAVIYEARPNVTFDVFSLCFKSGNACVLKGGSDAQFSNSAIVNLIHKVLTEHSIDTGCVYLAPADRESVKEVLNAREYIDVVIPRGGRGLIDFVREHARMPVIETGAGVVHTYFDVTGDLFKGKSIIYNAKTRRPSVCNALDTLLIHEERLSELKELVSKLAEKKVEIFADEKSFSALKNNYPAELLCEAKPEDFGTEFLSLKMSIRTVANVTEAVEHIQMYSSMHSEAIIAEDQWAQEYFLHYVDAAAVYANTSTAFTDGGMFGLGAEIGISTQKLHARGPMGLRELTSYKWIIRGNGQTRI